MAELYKYKITSLCYQDIDETLSYIKNTLLNPQASENLFEKISDAVQSVRAFPFASPDCTYYYIDDPNYRHIGVKNYILIYRVREETHTIEFLRFIYARRDFSKLNIDSM